MIGKTILHYKILEKMGEARLLKTCIEEILEVRNE
jgi:hypothetical protein